MILKVKYINKEWLEKEKNIGIGNWFFISNYTNKYNIKKENRQGISRYYN